MILLISEKKTDFDNKLLGFNESFNSNKTKHVIAENELMSRQKKLKQYHQKD